MIALAAKLVVVLDFSIVNVALPSMARDFGNASLEDLSWVLNGYAIVYAALLVFLGRLAELHAAGADTVYFHLYDVTDLDHVRLLGREVLPQVTNI